MYCSFPHVLRRLLLALGASFTLFRRGQARPGTFPRLLRLYPQLPSDPPSLPRCYMQQLLNHLTGALCTLRSRLQGQASPNPLPLEQALPNGARR